jgi:hypothetical protein
VPKFKCAFCEKEHDKLPRDLAYLHDLCEIDDSNFYVRGVLSLPIRNSTEEFRWGVWVKVKKVDFDRYVELWDSDPAAAPAYIGQCPETLPAIPIF